MFQRDELIGLSLAGVIALLVVTFAVFAGVFMPAPEPSARGVAPACSEWTDGCIVCARRPEGLACSTPGIACTRSAPRCLKP
jgi:hypothetical protein